MIPEGVNLDDLAEQLDHSHVAVSGIGSDDVQWRAGLEQSVADADAHGLHNLGFVAVDKTPDQPADLRDVAQSLQDVTGLDTVVVRAPQASGAVSDTLTRHAIEAAQSRMEGLDYSAGLREFTAAAVATTEPWGLIAAVVLTLVVVGCMAVAFGVHRVARHR